MDAMTTRGRRAPGTWSVPVAAALLTAGTLGFPGHLDAQEGREGEAGRECICPAESGGLDVRLRGLEELRGRLGELEDLPWVGSGGAHFFRTEGAQEDRGRLGIRLAARSTEGEEEGARIEGVLEGSPADEAGLEEGDVVIRFNGHRLTEPLPEPEMEDEVSEGGSPATRRLLLLARDIDPGDEVEIEFLRDGETRRVTVEAEEWTSRGSVGRPGGSVRPFPPDVPRPPRVRVAPRVDFERMFRGRGHGVELVPMNEGLSGYFGTDEGVLVADVDDDSELGLRPGDVLLRIGEREVRDPGHAARILSSYRDDETVRMEVIRKGERTTVEGRVE